ncbi:MAG: 50S ribosome-binding GTPase [Betaproteobacteria bacterium]|nr:50S ribosome-binding GTPase [Betaproteobacteria bacterium]
MQPLRFATAGSVDDGKSTLIGRLLYDARAVQEDQLAAVERASVRRGGPALDLSLLTDGLEAEREQGITIDVAYRYFATPERKFIIADSPGHEQYTRNMATGASNADAILLLVDVEKGLLPQTRRHALIARLLGIRHAIVFVNKMDRVAFSADAFRELEQRVRSFAGALDFQSLEVIPGSALHGDMVVERGESLAWYAGPTLLERLHALPASAEDAAAGPLRFPVQLAAKPQQGQPRGCMGRIDSGHLLVGTEVLVLPSGKHTRVRRILTNGEEREIAVAGDSVTVVLTDELDVARGDLIVDPAVPPREARELQATLVWLGQEPLRPGGRYLVQHAGRRTLARIASIEAKLDVGTLEETQAGEVALNDIARATLRLQSPVFVDSYEAVRATGAFILIDEASNHTVAAGLVR